MKIITVEEHFMSLQVNKAYTEITLKNAEPQEMAKADYIRQFVEREGGICDVGEKRIHFMDKSGVDIQIIGYGNNSPMDLAPEYAIPLCRIANDELAQQIEKFPARLYGFASLPAGDPIQAGKELKRCVEELGFCGAMLAGTYQGHFFDEEQFFPLFEQAAKLHVPISIHPGEVDPDIIRHYYEGSWSPQVTTILSGHGFGWHADAGIHILRLILSGLFDKLPQLQIISGHWGELVPYFLERLDETLPQEVSGLRKKISDYFKENIYVTPSGMFYDAPFQLCLQSLGSKRILWSMDYPYMMRSNTEKYLLNATITQTEKEDIAYRNAAQLFHLQ